MESNAATDSNDFAIVYLITKELAGAYEPLECPMRDVKSKLRIHGNHGDEQLKKWRECLPAILGCLLSGEVSPL